MKLRYGRIVATSLTFAVLAVAQGQNNGNGNGYGNGNNQGEDDRDWHQGAVHELNPHGLAHTKAAIPTGSIGTIKPLIASHSSTVIASPIIYFIWYGNWAQSNNSDTAAGQNILRDLAKGIGGSPYFNINTTYGQGITGSVSFGGEYTDNYSQGRSLRDSTILTIVKNAISHGLPQNSNGIYFVLTSSDVSEGTSFNGFCSAYCGWHTYGTANNQEVRYAFVGNANRCLNACAIQSTSPNGNAGVDGMASVVAHELEEATTDPHLNNWFDSAGAENADKCAWTFGQNLLTINNASYNMTLDSPTATQHNRPFLIQRNLTKASACYVSWNGSSGAQ